MKNHLPSYKHKLEERIGDYMEMPVTEHTAGAIKSMMECWDEIERLEKGAPAVYAAEFTESDAVAWNAKMVNEDGSVGGHWTMAQTTPIAMGMNIKFEHIAECDWNVAMNMMYSDYYKTATKFGVSVPEYYANLAKEFLFDDDGPAPKEKLAAYYHCIVK